MIFCKTLLINSPNQSKIFSCDVSEISNVIKQNFEDGSHVYVKVILQSEEDEHSTQNCQNGTCISELKKTTENLRDETYCLREGISNILNILHDSPSFRNVDLSLQEIENLKNETNLKNVENKVLEERISAIHAHYKHQIDRLHKNKDLKWHLDNKINWISQKMETYKSQMAEKFIDFKQTVERNMIEQSKIENQKQIWNDSVDEVNIYEKDREIEKLNNHIVCIAHEMNTKECEMKTQHERIAKLSSTIKSMENDFRTFCRELRCVQTYQCLSTRVHSDQTEELYEKFDEKLIRQLEIQKEVEREYTLQYYSIPEEFVKWTIPEGHDLDNEEATDSSKIEVFESDNDDGMNSQVNNSEKCNDETKSHSDAWSTGCDQSNCSCSEYFV